MDVQSLATASLLVPTVVLGVVAWHARRTGRTDFGLGWRDGGVGELARGLGWGVATLVVLVVVLLATRLLTITGYDGRWPGFAGIAAYFLVLFLLEEIAFRSVLLTGLGVVIAPVAAVVVVSVLVALPYALSPSTSVLAVAGAVVANAVNGVARLRTGRIWFGLGWRWIFNVGVLAAGLPDAAFRPESAVLAARRAGPDWLNGDGFGPEAGLVGIAIELLLIVLVLRTTPRFLGARGPWRVEPSR